MPSGDYTIHQRVGSGAQGAVYRATHTPTGETVAIKQIDVSHLNDKERAAVLSEVKVLATLSTTPHPNINLYRESFVDDPNLNIVLQWSANGSLLDIFNKAKESKAKMDEDEIWNYFLSVALALDHVHGRHILHRDVKMANVFIHFDDAESKEGNGSQKHKRVARVQLGDFGVSCILDDRSRAQTVVGTPYYLSPELCMGKKYSSKSDIWSLGVMLYVLINHKMPFEASNYAALILRIVQSEHARQKMTYSPILHKMATWCMQKSDTSRPSARQILEQSECQAAAMRLGLALPTDLKLVVNPAPSLMPQPVVGAAAGGPAAAKQPTGGYAQQHRAGAAPPSSKGPVGAATVKKRPAFNNNPAVPVRVSAPDRVQWRPSSGVKNPQPKRTDGDSSPTNVKMAMMMPIDDGSSNDVAPEDRPLPNLMRGQQAIQRGHLPNRRTRNRVGATSSTVKEGSGVQPPQTQPQPVAVGAPRNLYSRGRVNRPLSGKQNQGSNSLDDVQSSGYGQKKPSGSLSSRPPSIKDINAVASLPDYGGSSGSSEEDYEDEDECVVERSASSPMIRGSDVATTADDCVMDGPALAPEHPPVYSSVDYTSQQDGVHNPANQPARESLHGERAYSDQTMGFLQQLSQGDPTALHVRESLPEMEVCGVTWKVDDEEGASARGVAATTTSAAGDGIDAVQVDTDATGFHLENDSHHATFTGVEGTSVAGGDVPLVLDDTATTNNQHLGAGTDDNSRAASNSFIREESNLDSHSAAVTHSTSLAANQQMAAGSTINLVGNTASSYEHQPGEGGGGGAFFAMAQHTITSTVRTTSSIEEDDALQQQLEMAAMSTGNSLPRPQLQQESHHHPINASVVVGSVVVQPNVVTNNAGVVDPTALCTSLPMPHPTAQEEPISASCGGGGGGAQGRATYSDDEFEPDDDDDDDEHNVAGPTGHDEQQDLDTTSTIINPSLDASKTPMENLDTADVIATKVDELLNAGEDLVGPSVFAEVIDKLSGGGGHHPLQGQQLQEFVNARVPPENVAELMYVCFRYLFLKAEHSRMVGGDVVR